METAALTQPRIVVVTRKTNLEVLIEQHGTEGQARFWVECRGQDFGEVRAAHAMYERGLKEVLQQIPPERRRARIDRSDVDRFLFAPDDIVVVLGQDGLVPNVAKYLQGQPVVGINPDPARFDGVLCRHSPSALTSIFAFLAGAASGTLRLERRTMAIAEREDGLRLLALNELYVGHKTHQSARYLLRVNGR